VDHIDDDLVCDVRVPVAADQVLLFALLFALIFKKTDDEEEEEFEEDEEDINLQSE